MTSSNRTTGFFIDPFEELALQGALCRLSFWWLECDTWELRARPIYGQVIPTRSATPLQWVPREVGKRASLDGSKKRIVTRRSIVLPGLKIHGLLALLHTGLSLTDACQQLELPEIDVRLGGPWMNAEWDRLPAAFFSSVPSQSLLSPFAQGRTSVVPYAGCVCSRFAPQNRFKFLEDEQQSDEVLRWVAGLLRSETGIDFSGSAGDAFGCLEVFSFPSLDLRERSRVEVDYEKSADGTCCNVRLALTGAIAHADYIAQVRSEQVLSIASDQLVFFDESGLAAVNVPEPVDGVLVRVWRRTEGTWMLWDEIEQHFLRSIGIQGSLINLTGTVGASWLERLPPRLNPRAQKFSAISQVGMNLPMDISNRLSWGQGIQSARQVVRRMNPAPSGARFFQRGWGTDENKFEFAEWLKEQLSKCSGTIVVADPYFDLLGLDLICRASGAAKELVVVTNTQIKSLDDNGVTSRAERLREGAKQNLELLRGLNLRICDLQSRGGGNKQHLHDRYVLFYDQEDRPESGFHLSTSLQSAAATSPLLATPIPLDVVPAVAGYVAELLKPEEDTYDVVTLFPPDVTRATARRQGLSDTEAQSVLKLIEVAQGRTDLVHSSGTDRLRELGAFDGEKVPVSVKVVAAPIQVARSC